MQLTAAQKAEIYDKAIAKAGDELEWKMPLLTIEQKREFEEGFKCGWDGHKFTAQESLCTLFRKGSSEGRLSRSRIDYVMSILP